MTNHSFFVGIGNSACFQVAHRRKRFLDLRAHLVEEAVRKFHPADVDRETEIVVTEKILLKPLPKRRRSHDLRIMEGRPPPVTPKPWHTWMSSQKFQVGAIDSFASRSLL